MILNHHAAASLHRGGGSIRFPVLWKIVRRACDGAKRDGEHALSNMMLTIACGADWDESRRHACGYRTDPICVFAVPNQTSLRMASGSVK